MYKVCNKCGVKKDGSEFRTDKRNRSGLGSWCKVCARVYDRSPQKRLALKRYRQSEVGKIAIQKFWCSESGKAAKRRGGLRRRELKHNLDSNIDFTVDEIYSRFDDRCFKCNATKDLTVDHHYPLSRGFGLTSNNAVLLFRSCNSRKGAMLPSDFYTASELLLLEQLLFSVVS